MKFNSQVVNYSGGSILRYKAASCLIVAIIVVKKKTSSLTCKIAQKVHMFDSRMDKPAVYASTKTGSSRPTHRGPSEKANLYDVGLLYRA